MSVSRAVTVVAGVAIPSTSPWFLGGVAIHVIAALICVVAGLLAMFSPKGLGPHRKWGVTYYRALLVVFVTAAALSAARWAEDFPLFILATGSFAAANLGRAAQRWRRPGGVPVHIAAMGMSYVVLLTTFYVDNGKSLPVWRYLPQIAFWLLPGAIGAPIIAWAVLRHPLSRASRFTPPRAPRRSGGRGR